MCDRVEYISTSEYRDSIVNAVESLRNFSKIVADIKHNRDLAKASQELTATLSILDREFHNVISETDSIINSLRGMLDEEQ